MTDLTVLISPANTPLFPANRPKSPINFNFGWRSQNDNGPVSPRPVMVTLQTVGSSSAPSSPVRTRNPALLSPPINTFKSRPPRSPPLPPRPASAPPLITSFEIHTDENEVLQALKPPPRVKFHRRRTSFAVSTRGGELVRPAPPLFRPTTFWRKTRRSGVTGASYSPSSHLIRRSTFIAAGLSFDKPIADLSALCVESRLVTFITLALVAGGQCSTESQSTIGDQSTMTTMSRYNINYARQDPVASAAASSSSSYDYWWPYPPQGFPTLTPTPTTISGDLSSSIASTSTTSTSSSTSVSLIHITALPPATTTASNPSIPKLTRGSTNHLKLVYLSPLFALLGAVLGAASAWFIYGCYTRRCRVPYKYREGSLEPGPAYVASREKNGDDSGDELETILLQDDVDMGGSPSKYSKHGSTYSRRLSGGSVWLARTLSSHPRRESPGKNTSLKTFSWPTPSGHADDDPFLVPPPRGASTRTRTSARSKRSAASPDAGSLLGLREYMGEDDDEHVPYESTRHKSIRRGILERLKFGSPRRPEHAPVLPQLSVGSRYTPAPGECDFDDWDLCVDDLKMPERTYSNVTSPRKERDTIRAVGDKDETEWVAGSGFRIVEEDLEKGRSGEEKSLWEQVKERQSSPTKERDPGASWKSYLPHIGPPVPEEDKYTALPVRKTPSKVGSSGATAISSPSRTSTSQPRRTLGETAKPLTRLNASILPSSPPKLTSPPLESNLFFTPSQRQVVAPAGRRDVNESCVSKVSTTVAQNPGSAKTPPNRRKSNKLRSPRVPPLLPFPSMSESSPYRNRLQKNDSSAHKTLPVTPPRRQNCSSRKAVSAGSDDVSLDNSKGCLQSSKSTPTSGSRSTPAERYAARLGALSKVDEIVSRSWSERLSDIGSPTMFGAVTDAEGWGQ